MPEACRHPPTWASSILSQRLHISHDRREREIHIVQRVQEFIKQQHRIHPNCARSLPIEKDSRRDRRWSVHGNRAMTCSVWLEHGSDRRACVSVAIRTGEATNLLDAMASREPSVFFGRRREIIDWVVNRHLFSARADCLGGRFFNTGFLGDGCWSRDSSTPNL